MKNFKRILASVLALIMLMGMITVPSFAGISPIVLEDVDDSGDYWNWDAEGRVLTLSGFNGIGFYYNGTNYDEKVTIKVSGENYFDANDRYNQIDAFNFDDIDVEVKGNGVIYFEDLEIGFVGKTLTIDDVILSAEGVFCVADAKEITVKKSAFSMTDCAYGFGFDDITMTDSSVTFTAENLIDRGTFDDLCNELDYYPDKVCFANLFENWWSSEFDSTSIDLGDALLVDEYVTNVNIKDTDISFKVASKDVSKPFDDCYLFENTSYPAAVNVCFDNCQIYAENGDGLDAKSYVEFAYSGCTFKNGCEIELKNICDFVDDELVMEDSSVKGVITGYITYSDATISDSAIDLQLLDTTENDNWDSYGFDGENVVIKNSDIKVKAQDSAIETDFSTVKDSALYLESIDGYNYVEDPTFEYSVPSFWKGYADGVAIDKNVNELTSDDITNTQVFEIRFIHVCEWGAPEPFDEEDHIYRCKVEGCELTKSEAHEYKDYTYNNDATTEADGTETAACICGKTDTRTKAGTKLPTVKFTDVPENKWYHDHAYYAAQHGIITGTSETTFEPDTKLNRATFVTILAKLEGVYDGLDKNSKTAFTDVAAGKWFTGAVAWAVEAGITKGASATTFEPMSQITREQMCTMLVRYAEYKKITINTTVNAKEAFKDDSKIANYAKDAVYACQMAGIVNGLGDGNFGPKQTATRAQAAKIFSEFHKAYLAK